MSGARSVSDLGEGSHRARTDVTRAVGRVLYGNGGAFRRSVGLRQGVAELIDERGEELAEAAVMAAAVTADLVGAVVDEFADTAFDVVADLAYFLERLASAAI